jgi:hypothetical protein
MARAGKSARREHVIDVVQRTRRPFTQTLGGLRNVGHHLHCRDLRQDIQVHMRVEFLTSVQPSFPTQRQCRNEAIQSVMVECAEFCESTLEERLFPSAPFKP